MAEPRWSRRCRHLLAAACLASAAGAPALGQEIAAGDARAALLCGDQDAAEEVMATLHDPDAEIVVRRLVMMLTMEGCRETALWQGDGPAMVEPSGVIEIHRRKTTSYLVPLAAADH